MRSTMQDRPLDVASILRHGTTVHARSEVVTAGASDVRRASYGELGQRVAQLAGGLRRLGVSGDERVATFSWNNQEHLEAYLAVPAMGAVLHTLNIRLSPEQLTYIANHAEDRVVLADANLLPLLASVLPGMETVRAVVVVGPRTDAEAVAALEAALEAAGAPAGKRAVRAYASLLADEPPEFSWPEVDERAAAAMCYTSGTTGLPKGVAYSHRSIWLHSQAACTAALMAIDDIDRVLPVVPMFHANAWGLPYACLMSGASLVLPDRFLQADRLASLIATERVTLAGAVPTIWNDLLEHMHRTPVDLSSIRLVICGGSAVPPSLMQRFQDEQGIYIQQAWGMTETSPSATVARPPVGTPAEQEMRFRATQGRPLCGVEVRVTGDDGTELPNDGATVGEVEVRGPWVTGAYYHGDDPSRFHDGWLRTGDVGHLSGKRYLTLTDRAKDVIKSGGEWISSVELENALMAHPAVLESAVVGVPDPRWQERPLAAVVLRDGQRVDDTTARALQEWLGERYPRWMLPERWAFVAAVPRTSVGKFDKVRLRARYADGELAVLTLDGPAAAT